MLSKVILQAHIDKVETYFDRADKVVIVTHFLLTEMRWVLRWACIIFVCTWQDRECDCT